MATELDSKKVINKHDLELPTSGKASVYQMHFIRHSHTNESTGAFQFAKNIKFCNTAVEEEEQNEQNSCTGLHLSFYTN